MVTRKASKKGTKGSKGKARTKDAPNVTSAPKATERKASKGYDPTKDGPLHQGHPLVNDLRALSKRFYDHAVFYEDDGAFIVHRILSAVGRAIAKNEGDALRAEHGVYSAARSLLRSYGDPMPDEDEKGHPLGFRSLAGRFRILGNLLARLIRGHEIALERTKAHETEVAAEKRIDEIVATLRANGFTPHDVERIPPAIRTELVELAVTKARAAQILEKEQDTFDTFAHVLARLRLGENFTPIDHWRTPAKFEDNAWLVKSFLITYFPQIPSIQAARRDSACSVALGARIETYLRNLDKIRALKIAECQKFGYEYSVNEVAEDLAFDILRNECKFSGMAETRISKWLGFYTKRKQ